MSHVVSVVVPVYNVEKYLRECLESLRCQTYTDIEVIMIDDASPDESPKICDEFASVDKRFQVYHVQNGGVSQARNFGASRATGQWIMFLDSDDYLEENAIELLVNTANSQHADIISMSYYMTFRNSTILVGHDDGKEQIINLQKEKFLHDMLVYPEAVLLDYPTCLVPWGKIIKKELTTKWGVEFPLDLHPHEDAIYNVQLFKIAEKQVYMRKPLIYYRQRKNASTKSKKNDNFLNNKKFCLAVHEIHQMTGGVPVLSREDYSVLCAKYFAYAMINLWPANKYSYSRARKQLIKYLNDTVFAQALEEILNVNLAKYNFPKRLRVSIICAAKHWIFGLLTISFVADLRSKLKEKNPYNRQELFP